MASERVEPLRPEAPVGLEPLIELLEPGAVDLVHPPLRVGPSADEARLTQDSQVLGGPGLAQPKPRDQLADRARALAEQRQHRPAVRVGQGRPRRRRHHAHITKSLYTCQGIRKTDAASSAAA